MLTSPSAYCFKTFFKIPPSCTSEYDFVSLSSPSFTPLRNSLMYDQLSSTLLTTCFSMGIFTKKLVSFAFNTALQLAHSIEIESWESTFVWRWHLSQLT